MTWKYKGVWIDTMHEMNDLGAEGWELVCVTATPENCIGFCIFKMPVAGRTAEGLVGS